MSAPEAPTREPSEDQEPWDYSGKIEQPLGAIPTDPDADDGEADGRPAAPDAGRKDGEDAPAVRDDTQRDGTRDGAGRNDRPQNRDTRQDEKVEPENREADQKDGEREASDPAAPDDQRDDRDGSTDEGGEKTEDGKQDEDGKDEPPPPPPSKWVFVAVGLVLVALLAWGGFARWKRDHAAGEARDSTLGDTPQVRVAEAKREDGPVDLTLPGQTEAFATASLFARATGYISERHADIGTRVKKGELLVHITAPDLDQQLAQAEAQVGQVKAAEAQAQAQVTQADANVNLAKVTLARTAQLTERGYDTLQNRDNQTASLLTQQANLDTAKAGVKVAEANTRAQLATVDRLKALAGFEDVRAPFDGVVTVRNVDVGDLVNADTATASPLFSLAQDDMIRVTVQVPQNNAVGVRNGLGARIEVPQLPGQTFAGTVTRSSVALLSSARTLDTEVDIPNPDGKLRPGLFTYVTIGVPRAKPDVMVPAEALIFNQNGLKVATVADDTVKLRDVKVGRDFGKTVALVEGLEGGEQVVLSPPALLKEGDKVKVRKPEDEKKNEPGKDKDGTAQNPNEGKPVPDKGKQPG